MDKDDLIALEDFMAIPYFDPHDTIALHYDPDNNRFTNGETGAVVSDIHRILTPDQIFLFKYRRESLIFLDVTSQYFVEVIYPDYNYTKHS